MEALAAGSFKINFKIDLQKENNLFFDLTITQLNNFLNKYFNYILDKLPREQDDVFRQDEVNSESFKQLESDFKDLYEKQHIGIPQDLEHKIIDNISYAILPLKEIPYNNSFTRLELSNYSSKLEEIPVAIIDENYIANVTSKVFQVQGNSP